MADSKFRQLFGQASRLPVVTEDGTSRSIVIGDQNKCIEFTSTSAVTVTIERGSFSSDNANCAGLSMLLKRLPTTGLVTVVAGNGVTLESDNGNFTLATNSKIATIFYLEDNRAIIAGGE